MKAYADFDLQIERSRGAYNARVLRSPVGVLPPAEFSPPFSQGELQALVPLATGARRDRDVKARRPKSAQAAFREAGAKLFRTVFAGELLACWKASLAASSGKVLRLRLHLSDPELAAWPWEYLLEPRLDRWLAISPDVSIVRYPDLPEALEPFTVTPPLRVLVLVAARTGRRPLAAEREWEHIEEGLSGLRESGQVVLERLESVSLRALREKLRRETWHVLHFIGHGGLDAEGEGALLFEHGNGGREEVSGRDLGALVLGHSALRLVVLNSCEGAREGRSDAFSSVAQALVRSRVPAVVAMQVALSDQAAVSFARHFYRELAEGDSLDEVLTQTRHGMFSEGHKVEWGTPVLFLRAESGQIFEIARPWLFHGVVAALVLLLVLGFWMVPFLFSRGSTPQAPMPDSPSNLLKTKTDPRCPMPPDLHMPFKLIEPVPDEHGTMPFPVAICITAFEVTQEQWKKVMGEASASSRPGPDRPVEKVSLAQAREFAYRLTQSDPGGKYRLPRDAEWTFVAQAMPHELDLKLLSEYGNCAIQDGFERTAPVGQFQPNEFGVYDLLGNVWEWVEDSSSPGKGLRRGGGWNSFSRDCSASGREESSVTYSRNDTGFRIVRDPLPAAPK